MFRRHHGRNKRRRRCRWTSFELERTAPANERRVRAVVPTSCCRNKPRTRPFSLERSWSSRLQTNRRRASRHSDISTSQRTDRMFSVRLPLKVPSVWIGLRRKETEMKSRFSEEQIIAILKQHQAGVPVADLCRKHGVSHAAWRSRTLVASKHLRRRTGS